MYALYFVASHKAGATGVMQALLRNALAEESNQKLVQKVNEVELFNTHVI